ncbi:uncharacterized protein LOC111243734 [Varroa destructor]|uniref:Cuticle protein 14 n=1 Tax=Varroa destructor TaxID=109461 RepID=A0A7M7M3I2_VARDE|nr:uncharacterized protein LOC111243734 [Varroa destructor]
MRTFIANIALFASASAAFSSLPSISSDASVSSRSADGQGNYKFSYNEKHSTGGSFRLESGNAYGGVTGSYGLVDADGRQRIVTYVADANGFRASIKTNEPGTVPNWPVIADLSSSNLRKNPESNGQERIIQSTPGIYTHLPVIPSFVGSPPTHSTRITHSAAPVVTHHVPVASVAPVSPPINFNTYSTRSPNFREVTPLSVYTGVPILPLLRATPISYSHRVTHRALAPVSPAGPVTVSPIGPAVALSRVSFPRSSTYSSRIVPHANQAARPVSYSSQIAHEAQAPKMPAFNHVFKQVAPVPLDSSPLFETPRTSSLIGSSVLAGTK